MNNSQDKIYAGFWVRVAAALIDVIITSPLAFAILYIIGVDIAELGTLEQVIDGVAPEPTKAQRIADFISWVVAISYSVYFVSSKSQATPGKKIMNIYIATVDGKKLSVNQCFARFLGTVLSGLLLGAGFLMVAFTKEKTALHDIICKTRVFYGKKT